VLYYTIQRVGLALLICIVAMTAMFSLVYVIPGDPASIALGPRATPEMRQALAARMGLDRPVPIQIVNFFGNVLSGDLGVDVWSNRSVATSVFESLPYTLALAAAGLGWFVKTAHLEYKRNLAKAGDQRSNSRHFGQRDL